MYPCSKSSKNKVDDGSDNDDESDEDMTEIDDGNDVDDVDKFGCVYINNDDDENVEVDSNSINEKTTEECVGLMNPRQYQLELYQYVRRQNTIVMLGTGQGKTLIAILSMKYFLETQPKKQVWCLVPSVALAIQLANVIRANLPYRVGVVCHTSEHSDTARSDWSTAPMPLSYYLIICHELRQGMNLTVEKKENSILIFRNYYCILIKNSIMLLWLRRVRI